MSKHAVLSASGSSRWLNCPGSVKACKTYANTSSSFAQEGTCAHELAAMVLQDQVSPHDYIGKTLNDAPEIVVDKEMANYVEEYVNYVNAIPGDKLIEQQVDYSPWAQGGFGTADAIVFETDEGIVHVIDLKYGKGVEVSADNNTQGMLYALGVYNEYEFDYEFDTIIIHIYQPRIGNICEWTITVKELLKWADEEVKPTAILCMSDNAPRIAGTKQCQWCPNKHQCVELKSHIEATISSEFDDLTLPVVEEGIDFQNIMSNKKLIEGWLKAIEGHIFEQLEKGIKMPGFKLVAGKTSRSWADEVVTEKYMRKKRMKVGEIFNQKLITPPQAEKFLGKKKYAEMVDEALIIKRDGKPTLANESDKRVAINLNVTDDFDDLEEEF